MSCDLWLLSNKQVVYPDEQYIVLIEEVFVHRDKLFSWTIELQNFSHGVLRFFIVYCLNFMS